MTPTVRGAAWTKARRYLAAAGACLAASLVNPYFYKLHTHVLGYLTDSFAKEHVYEFFSLNFHHPVGPFFEVLLLVGAWAAVWHASRGNFRALVLIGVWGHAALLSARNIPLFAIFASPFIAVALDYGVRRIPQLPLAGWLKRSGSGLVEAVDGMAEMELVGRWHLLSALAAAGIAVLLFAPAPPKPFRAEFDPTLYPAAALKTMNFGREARIFTNDEWGDYLIFSLYERGTKVFVDGRTDFYGREFEKKYTGCLHGEVRLGADDSPVRHRHDFVTRHSVNDRRAQGIEPLEGRLRRRHHARVPARAVARGRGFPGFRCRRRRRKP